MTDGWFEAAEAGDLEGVWRRLDGGADVNAADEYGQTALMFAAEGRQEATVRFLLDRGADVHAENRRGWTALTFAVSRPSPRFPGLRWVFPATGSSPSLYALLREAGARPGLREAVLLGDVDLVRYRLDAGDDPSGDACWVFHDTYLMLAADHGHIEVVRLLLDRGADVEGTDDLGHKALLRAALANRPDIVTLLLDRGAGVTDNDWPDEAALDEAAALGRPELVDRLIAQAATHGLAQAISLHDDRLVGDLLGRGAEPDHVFYDFAGRSAWHAVREGSLAAVGLLLDHRAKLYNPELDPRPLLNEAAALGRQDVVQLLLDRGANVHAVGGDGKTARALAVEHGHGDVVACLEKAGATR